MGKLNDRFFAWGIMMRYSRTTLKELKRRYALILKKCFLLNMMLGVLAFASSAIAEETSTEGDGVATQEETEGGDVVEDESEGEEPDDPTLEEEIKDVELPSFSEEEKEIQKQNLYARIRAEYGENAI